MPYSVEKAIQVDRERPELLGESRSWLANQEQQAFYVKGEANFVLVMATCSCNKALEDSRLRWRKRFRTRYERLGGS
jgi:hypothetical protein